MEDEHCTLTDRLHVPPKEIMMLTMMMMKVNLKACNVQIYDITTLAVLYIGPNVDFTSGKVIAHWLQITWKRALLPWFDDCPTVFIAGLWRIAALALLDFCLYQEKRELDKNSSLKSPLLKIQLTCRTRQKCYLWFMVITL